MAHQSLAGPTMEDTKPKMVEIKVQDKSFFARPHGRFWDSVIAGTWEPETFKVFEKFLDKEHSYVDIGAWIGPTVLFGAQLAREVIAFEPDPVAYEDLLANISLNQHKFFNIKVYPVAIADKDEPMEFGAFMNFGDSMSSLFQQKNKIKVTAYKLETAFNQLAHVKDCNFIKMDIEGGEVIVLPEAASFFSEHKEITLYLSLHAPFMNDAKKYFDKLIGVLAQWKYLYDAKTMKQVNFVELVNLPGFSAIIATNKKI